MYIICNGIVIQSMGYTIWLFNSLLWYRWPIGGKHDKHDDLPMSISEDVMGVICQPLR